MNSKIWLDLDIVLLDRESSLAVSKTHNDLFESLWQRHRIWMISSEILSNMKLKCGVLAGNGCFQK